MDTFIKENLKELNVKDHKCKSSKVSYLLSLKALSIEKTLICAFSFLNEKKIASEEKQLTWMLLHDIYKEKKLTKKKNFALKQSSNVNKKVSFKKEWYFLGPFQIGKPEFDGNPIESNRNIILNRWNSKLSVYSEIINSGILKWTTIQSDSNGVISLQPEVNWNDLVMSLQSMAVTEWQGLLLNEFVVFSDGTEILVQCMGVNLFYIDDIVVNGDIYHRDQYWWALLYFCLIYFIKLV